MGVRVAPGSRQDSEAHAESGSSPPRGANAPLRRGVFIDGRQSATWSVTIHRGLLSTGSTCSIGCEGSGEGRMNVRGSSDVVYSLIIRTGGDRALRDRGFHSPADRKRTAPQAGGIDSSSVARPQLSKRNCVTQRTTSRSFSSRHHVDRRNRPPLSVTASRSSESGRADDGPARPRRQRRARRVPRRGRRPFGPLYPADPLPGGARNAPRPRSRTEASVGTPVTAMARSE